MWAPFVYVYIPFSQLGAHTQIPSSASSLSKPPSKSASFSAATQIKSECSDLLPIAPVFARIPRLLHLFRPQHRYAYCWVKGRLLQFEGNSRARVDLEVQQSEPRSQFFSQAIAPLGRRFRLLEQ